ncbi:helix-turn-helix domain-containing protein [Oribacterium sp. WCC10]|uniref:helix-turn-helix domain-containing protein n=1 Tax=Oribacterium sp. WCC10 TaxID=1855343 RepID=UPI0008E64036|nr:helix-turn-helix transcriptional regulator [Oribacterium sp. WCC10]SFG78174.1 Helix-turn-helix domain-containing protein [Oribacterium sp. WCC10]
MRQEDTNSTFSVGKRIRIIRKRKGMSQEDLAEKMFTSKQMISAYETDKIDIKVSVLKEFGKALEIYMAGRL